MPEVRAREELWTEPASRRRLFFRLWNPPGAQALVVVVHGFGEHGGRYGHVAEALAGQGICVAVPDLWGHGRSGGARGDAEGIHRYVEDLREMTTQVFLPAAGRERATVYAHSFGALVAIHWALAHPAQLERMVIQSPLLATGFSVPVWKTAMARWLERWWPTASFPMNLDATALSRHPDVGRAYRADPCVHNRISARLYGELQRAGVDAVARAPALEMPVLCLSGMGDRLVSLEAIQEWFGALTCRKREVRFPEAYHELHHESVRDEVLRLVREWVLGA